MPLLPRNVPARGRSVLTLDGTVCGFVISAEGGDISAPVIREPAGAFVRKRLGAASPGPIVLSFDLSLDHALYDWVAEFWKGGTTPKDGSVIFVDQNDQARSELLFEHAEIAATTMPALNAASKAHGRLSLRLIPATTTMRPASGPVGGVGPKPVKPWVLSSFHLEVDGLDTTHVSNVEPLTVARGEEGTIDFPDLRVLLSEVSAKSWLDWHEEFVVEGKNDAAHEKSGSLVLLMPDLQTELGRVTLGGLGIHHLAPEPVGDRGAAQIRRLLAELYCQNMELAIP